MFLIFFGAAFSIPYGIVSCPLFDTDVFMRNMMLKKERKN